MLSIMGLPMLLFPILPCLSEGLEMQTKRDKCQEMLLSASVSSIQPTRPLHDFKSLNKRQVNSSFTYRHRNEIPENFDE